MTDTIYGVEIDLLPEPYRTQAHQRIRRWTVTPDQGLIGSAADMRLLDSIQRWVHDYRAYFGHPPQPTMCGLPCPQHPQWRCAEPAGAHRWHQRRLPSGDRAVWREMAAP
jgi:hypothetical protein